MTAVALYNLKGGVGKTTAAVNLAYLAAAAGQRVLLWDLDPQGASSFIFRVRPRVADFGRKTLKSGEALADAIKETDYGNLDLLPADFSYRKFDRILQHLGRPARVLRTLLDTLGHDYDIVFLDCPAGFSLLTEAVLETADVGVVPTIPTPLSVRTLARILKWADRRGSALHVAPFLSMVDRRKVLHRRACDWSADHPDICLAAHIPYASIVEQMTVRRMPLAAFGGRDPSATAFADLWAELRTRLEQARLETERSAGGRPTLQAIEALAAELDFASSQVSARTAAASAEAPALAGDALVHYFDTEDHALSQSGHVLELREYQMGLVVVAGRLNGDGGNVKPAQVNVDGSWALQILSGEMSPVAVLDRRLGRPGPRVVEDIRAIVGQRKLCRIDSQVAHQMPADRERLDPGGVSGAATCA